MTNNKYTQLSISIDKLGTHLLKVTNHHTGEVNLKWDWDKLLEEVQAACASVSTNIVEVTEAKVKKTRAKKAETPAAKKPAAKKPAAKKATTKKSK